MQNQYPHNSRVKLRDMIGSHSLSGTPGSSNWKDPNYLHHPHRSINGDKQEDLLSSKSRKPVPET